MKERPIIFGDAMVRAILAGTKTQTRRVIKNKAVLDSLNEVGSWDGPGEVEDWERSMCPYGVSGDRLWVREAWKPCVPKSGVAHYRADADEADLKWHSDQGHKWRPSIHMPRWASRITLEIVRVRLQRVQEISEEDAMAEGTQLLGYQLVSDDGSSRPYTHRDHFEALWDFLNEARGYPWKANPWVWAVEFKRVEDKKCSRGRGAARPEPEKPTAASNQTTSERRQLIAQYFGLFSAQMSIEQRQTDSGEWVIESSPSYTAEQAFLRAEKLADEFLRLCKS